MRGCGITPFFCVDKFYIHVDLLAHPINLGD